MSLRKDEGQCTGFENKQSWELVSDKHKEQINDLFD